MRFSFRFCLYKHRPSCPQQGPGFHQRY
jgi:hypothetical protein